MNLHKDLHGYLIVNINYTLFYIPYHSYYIFDQSSCDYIS